MVLDKFVDGKLASPEEASSDVFPAACLFVDASGTFFNSWLPGKNPQAKMSDVSGQWSFLGWASQPNFSSLQDPQPQPISLYVIDQIMSFCESF